MIQALLWMFINRRSRILMIQQPVLIIQQHLQTFQSLMQQVLQVGHGILETEIHQVHRIRSIYIHHLEPIMLH